MFSAFSYVAEIDKISSVSISRLETFYLSHFLDAIHLIAIVHNLIHDLNQAKRSTHSGVGT